MSLRVPQHLVVLLTLLIFNCAYGHNTGVPHREFTAEELRGLGLEELIPPTTTATLSETSETYTFRGPVTTDELWTSWGLEPGVLFTLTATALLYSLGLSRLWRATHIGAGIRVREAAYFGLGWLWLVIALVSPLHPWGEVLFSAHMVQHELLMLVAAPLLILGRPLIAILWALPIGWRRQVGRAASGGMVAALWQVSISPLVTWAVHAVVLWVWHIPSWFQATLVSELVHTLQHMSFLVSALLFWFAVLHGRSRQIGYGMAVLYMFTTAVHSGALGALLTFTTTVWYPAYAQTAPAWGLSALEDQQLGGLIMWMPAGLIYIVTGLLLFNSWLRESEKRARVSGAVWERARVMPLGVDAAEGGATE